MQVFKGLNLWNLTAGVSLSSMMFSIEIIVQEGRQLTSGKRV
jgi:hypothetical protein